VQAPAIQLKAPESCHRGTEPSDTMPLTIDLRPDVEALLAARAAERGMSLEQYACAFLEAYDAALSKLSPAEQATQWLEVARSVSVPSTPPNKAT
jgi:hypothetical protein